MIARRVAVATILCLAASAAGAAPEPLPADPPMGGVVWSLVVPAILFAFAFGATYMLYRHFARGQE